MTTRIEPVGSDRASPEQLVEAVTAVGVRSLINALAIAAGTPIDWPKVPRIPEP